MDNTPRIGLEHRGVRAGAAVQIEIVVKEELDLARLRPKVSHDDFSEIDVRVGIHDFVAAQSDSEVVVEAIDVGDHGLTKIGQPSLPVIALHPTELVVRPHAEPERRTAVVFLTDMREVDVREAISGIECDDEWTIA